MSSQAAPRCRHIKINGTQCGSPALRNKNFCFYHQANRPWAVECYFDGPDATGEITLPYFEDAHSLQAVIRQVVQMVLQKRLGRKTAGLLLYALQIASSNLKRMELEKPQPEQVVVDFVQKEKWQIPIAAITENEAARENSGKISDETSDQSPDEDINPSNEDLPPGTIYACYRPNDQTRSRVVTAARPREVRRYWLDGGFGLSTMTTCLAWHSATGS
ncbi:MAG: hypothetical protein ACLPLR_19435 [Terriglobales bacterium]